MDSNKTVETPIRAEQHTYLRGAALNALNLLRGDISDSQSNREIVMRMLEVALSEPPR